MHEDDTGWMTRALELAEDSIGMASPNPQVGCTLVHDGVLLGSGAHHYDRRDHAEIVALKDALTHGHTVQRATAYVTLEPCSHHGRTGPCADALIAAGVARVVVATADPNPQVAGEGLQRLRTAGVEVELAEAGDLRTRARRLNDGFACSITRGRPLVTLKAALSVDGMLAPPASLRVARETFWLTGPEARADVQRMRHGADAILTGIGTVLADDPLLTDRSGLPRRRGLVRVVLDGDLRMPPDAALLRTVQPAWTAMPDLWIFHAATADTRRAKALRERGARLLSIPGCGAGLDPEKVLEALHAERLLEVLVEAGPAINGSLLDLGLVDRVALFFAPRELGPAALPFAHGPYTPFELERQLLRLEKRSFGQDVCVSGLLRDPWIKLSAGIG